MKCFLIIITLFLAQFKAFAVNDIKIFKFEHFSLNEKISSVRIVTIYQDENGFMWFGTSRGLNRYDGYEIKEYLYQPNDSTSLSHAHINAVAQDKNGNLWFASGYGGLNLLKPDGENFVQIHHNPADTSGLSGDALSDLCLDHSGDLWIGAKRKAGLNRLVKDNNGNYTGNKYKFIKYLHNPGDTSTISHSSVKTIYQDHANKLWIGTYNGLNRFNRETGDFSRYLYNANRNNSVADIEINAIFQDKGGRLWVGTDKDGLYYYDTKKDFFTRYNEIEPVAISSITQDRKGFIWIGTINGDGIYLLDKKYKIYTHLQKNNLDPFSLSDNYINQIYMDYSGIIWIGTETGGIDKFDWKKQRFSHLYNKHSKKYSLNDNFIPAVFEADSETIFVGTGNSGLDCVNLATGSVKNYPIHISDNQPAKIQSATAIYEDYNGIIWIGTDIGLCIFELKNKRIIHYQNYLKNSKNKKYISLPVESLFQDSAGYLWIGTHGEGLVKFDIKHEQFTHYMHDLDNRSSLGGDYIFCIYQDRAKNLWCGNGGLNIFNPVQNKFVPYRSGVYNPDSIKLNYIGDIFEDENDVLWLTTVNEGLIKYDRQNNRLKTYTTRDGLVHNTTWSVLRDNSGNFWISSDKGISKFNPDSEVFTNYDKSDGLQSNQFISSAHYKGNSGRIYLGGVNGLTIFNPDSIRPNPTVPKVALTDFTIFNKSILPGKKSALKKAIQNTKTIKLSYKDYIFGFKFAALEFSNPQKNQYAYKMEGLDTDWIYADATNRFATYTRLNPGEYVFRVKGSNDDGVWNEKAISVNIFITPPWWLSNLAYGIYVILAGILIWLTWHYQTKRIKLKQQLNLEHLHAEKLQEIDQLKSRFFANISHEFRTPLTLIIGPVRQMLDGKLKGNIKSQYKIILKNAERLFLLINQLLDLTKLESGKLKLHTEPADIVSITNYLVQAFESLANQNGIKLKYISNTDYQNIYIDIKKYEQIINNLLSNAFKFTPEGGEIKVSLQGLRTPAGRIDDKLADDEAISSGKGIATPRQAGTPDDNEHLPDQDLNNDLPHSPSLTKGVKQGCIHISVSNTGSGIPANQLDKIFDRFYSIKSDKHAEGTGIGLALTKELVELHHGTISVDCQKIGEQDKLFYSMKSQHENRDLCKTSFTIVLPAGKKHLKQDEIIDFPSKDTDSSILARLKNTHVMKTDHDKKPFSARKYPVSGMHAPMILLVENNIDLRTYVRDSMEKFYQIIEAENGKDGFQLATDKIPDLIISDVMMPEMDGFELCAKLKTDQRTSHIPVILLTARAAKEDKIEGLETGADDFIPKPFDIEELRIRIKNLIDLRRQLRKTFTTQSNLVFDKITTTSADEKFVKHLMKIIAQHISDSDFKLESLSNEAGLSQMQLHRKIKGLFGQSPAEFIKTIRLKHGADLLKKKTGNISEVAFAVGFDNPSYFATCFRQQFGISPSEFLKNLS